MVDVASRISRLISELQRRKVFRVAAGYGAGAFIIAQASAFLPDIGLPEWFHQFVLYCLILGFPLALALAWSFDIKRDTADPGDAALTKPGSGTSATKPPPATPLPRPTLPKNIAGVERPKDKAQARLAPLPAEPPAPERVERASLAQMRDELRTPATAIVGYTRMLLSDVNGPGREALRRDLDRIRTAGELFISRLEHFMDPEHPAWHQEGGQDESQLTRMRHELRTPLNAVIGYSELILEEHLDRDHDQAVAEDVLRILAAGREALGVVDVAVRSAAAGKAVSKSTVVAHGVLSKLQPVRDATMPLRQGTLLVVDDIEANRELIAHQLARQGYTVSKAASGPAALEQLATQDIDLILLDILMPGMDGVDVLARLKADDELAQIPVIVISAIDELDSVIRCIQLGADDYIAKPFDPVLLGARIGVLLERQDLRKREQVYAQALRRQEEWTDGLLRRAFPEMIAARIKAGETSIVESATEASVLVAGIQGLTLARDTPAAHVERLSALFVRFDQMADQFQIELVRTMGSTYVAVAGLPPVDDHERRIADLALAMQAEISQFAKQHNEHVRMRVGIHIGPVSAGVISSNRVAFDVWGEGVETAEQLQLNATPGTIQASPAMHARLRGSHALSPRGVVDVPGKGSMRTYVLERVVADAV